MKFENAQFINVQMKEDEVLSEHYTRETAIIIVRKGRVKFNFGGDTDIVTNENIFSMEPSEVHDVLALEDTDFMIIKVIYKTDSLKSVFSCAITYIYLGSIKDTSLFFSSSLMIN